MEMSFYYTYLTVSKSSWVFALHYKMAPFLKPVIGGFDFSSSLYSCYDSARSFMIECFWGTLVWTSPLSIFLSSTHSELSSSGIGVQHYSIPILVSPLILKPKLFQHHLLFSYFRTLKCFVPINLVNC